MPCDDNEISFTDYIGHLFGPSSLESEDNILRLDRVLAELFAYVDEQVGLDKTLIVLSGDHGGPDAPGYLNSMGIPSAYVDPEEWDRAAAIDRLKSKFRISGELFESYAHPYLYFSSEIKNKPKIDLNDFDGLIVSSTHGSPWNYDTHVPVVFNGPGIEAQVVDRRVHTVDVAATIAAILGIRAPSGSVGEPLQEVLGQ